MMSFSHLGTRHSYMQVNVNTLVRSAISSFFIHYCILLSNYCLMNFLSFNP